MAFVSDRPRMITLFVAPGVTANGIAIKTFGVSLFFSSFFSSAARTGTMSAAATTSSRLRVEFVDGAAPVEDRNRPPFRRAQLFAGINAKRFINCAADVLG